MVPSRRAHRTRSPGLVLTHAGLQVPGILPAPHSPRVAAGDDYLDHSTKKVQSRRPKAEFSVSLTVLDGDTLGFDFDCTAAGLIIESITPLKGLIQAASLKRTQTVF